MWRAAAAALFLAHPLAAQEITAATYAQPTDEYPHNVLGDALEWKELRIDVTRRVGTEKSLFSAHSTLNYRIVAPDGLVFEDTAPRLWDVTGDGSPEVVVVQSHQELGARLMVVGLADGVPEYLAWTSHIGTRFRWLAPVGAADFDGDGHIELAFIDRPHLAKILRVFRYTPDSFDYIGGVENLSNHRIGEDFISGGVRDCGEGPEMILADGRWEAIMAVRISQTEFLTRRVKAFEGPGSFDEVLSCRHM